MNIILFGAPGSGKGTQSKNLSNDYNFIKVSTGALLRNEISSNSNLGKKIKSIIDSGSFASDIIINDLVKNFMHGNNISKNFIFDGYPRNIQQAEILDGLLKKIKKKIFAVFYLDVKEDILIKRLVGRIYCKKCEETFNEFFYPPNCKCGPEYLIKRSDDNEKIAKKRFETYVNETLPVLKYYENKKILNKVDGSGEISSIYKEIKSTINALND